MTDLQFSQIVALLHGVLGVLWLLVGIGFGVVFSLIAPRR